MGDQGGRAIAKSKAKQEILHLSIHNKAHAVASCPRFNTASNFRHRLAVFLLPVFRVPFRNRTQSSMPVQRPGLAGGVNSFKVFCRTGV